MRQKILSVVAVLFGLMMINSGFNKFFNYMPMPEDIPDQIMQVMGAFMQISWLMPLVAVAEIAGGVLFSIPRFRALGAVIIFPVMAGIIVHHAVYAPEGIILPLILLAIVVWAIVEDRKRYLPMIN